MIILTPSRLKFIGNLRAAFDLKKKKKEKRNKKNYFIYRFLT